MRRKTPNWVAVSLLGGITGLQEKFFCSTCGTICERVEKLNANPKDCINPERLEKFVNLLSHFEKN